MLTVLSLSFILLIVNWAGLNKPGQTQEAFGGKLAFGIFDFPVVKFTSKKDLELQLNKFTGVLVKYSVTVK